MGPSAPVEDDGDAGKAKVMPLLPFTSPTIVRNMRALPLRVSDCFVCSYPKSGTTWIQNILFQLLRSDDTELTHISDFCPFYEAPSTWEAGGSVASDLSQRQMSSLNGWRIFNTHMRWSQMPREPQMRGKYLYVVRGPLDVLVSFYHHMVAMAESDGGFSGSFTAFAEEWLQGRLAYGRWVDHLAAWQEAVADPRVLVLHYEDMKADLPAQVLRIIKHLGLERTIFKGQDVDLIVAERCTRMSFAYMRDNLDRFSPRSVQWRNPDFCFVRNGKVGDHEELVGEELRVRVLDAMQATLGKHTPALVKTKLAKTS